MTETNTNPENSHILGSEYVARLPTRRISQVALDRRECVICRENFTDDPDSRLVEVECCKSKYHSCCLLEWCGEDGAGQDNCPYCRKKLFRTYANAAGQRFNPTYRYNPERGFWINGDSVRVSEEEVSDYIEHAHDVDMEVYREEFRAEGEDVDDFEDEDGPQYAYVEGQWFDRDGDDVYPHQVHDFLTGGWDRLEEQRAEAEWHRLHNA